MVQSSMQAVIAAVAVREGEDCLDTGFESLVLGSGVWMLGYVSDMPWKDKALSSAKMHMENYQRTGDKCGEAPPRKSANLDCRCSESVSLPTDTKDKECARP